MEVKNVRLALLGFGNVGRAFALLIMKKATEIFEQRGLRLTVTGIATGRHGRVIDPDGVDLRLALDQVQAGQPLDGDPQHIHPATVEEFVRQVPADVLIETIPVTYETGKPAVDLMRIAIKRGMHGITANKGTMVHGYSEFKEICARKNTRFAYESTVLDGIPIFSLVRDRLPHLNITGFGGILNATSNLILNMMEHGSSFDEAVKEAQRLGIAETDPSGDIDGWDAAVKVAALATAVLNHPLLPTQVAREGVRSITPEMVMAAKADGKRYKMVCEAYKTEDGVDAKVSLKLLSSDSFFYGIDSGTSYVEFYSDSLPVIGLVEAGEPAPEATAYGILTDLLDIVG